MREEITLPNGRTLHRWTNSGGEEWACVAYNHGPLCRLCQPVTGTLAALLSNLMDGWLEIVGSRPDGEFLFRVTKEGERRVEHLTGGDHDA